MYFTDPYHGTDEGEPLMNEPHGYLTGDDVKNSFRKLKYKINSSLWILETV